MRDVTTVMKSLPSLAWPDRYFCFCGGGKNRVWHISDTKRVLTPNRFWLGVNWILVTYSP